jgi:hypothetical protein
MNEKLEKCEAAGQHRWENCPNNPSSVEGVGGFTTIHDDGSVVIGFNDNRLEYVQGVYDSVRDAVDEDRYYRRAMEFMALQFGIPLKIKRD